jgi:hypothetical protein
MLEFRSLVTTTGIRAIALSRIPSCQARHLMTPAYAIAVAMSAGAAALSVGSANVAIKDAYAALRSRLRQQHYEGAIDSIEKDPQSPKGVLVLSAAIERDISKSQLTDLLEATRSLLEAVATSPHVHVAFEELKTANNVIMSSASEGTGVRIIGSSAGGNIVVGDRDLGVRPVEPWPTPGKRSK